MATSTPVLAEAGFHICDNCGMLWDAAADELAPISDLLARIGPGGMVPSGECPDCGSLCYPQHAVHPLGADEVPAYGDEHEPSETPEETETRKEIRREYAGKLWMSLREEKKAGKRSPQTDCLEHVVNHVLTDGQLKALVERRESEAAPAWAGSFSTTCPYCSKSDKLMVASATLVETGKRIHPKSELLEDGFDVDPRGELDDGLKDYSTTDETVVCNWCHNAFDLSKVTL